MKQPAWRVTVLAVFLFLAVHAPPVRGNSYDPLRVAEHPDTRTLDLTVEDTRRNREVPIRVYLPAGKSRAPVVLFSHGLGGSRKGCKYLGRHWSARGYVAVFLQHPSSDTSVWKGEPIGERMTGTKDVGHIGNADMESRLGVFPALPAGDKYELVLHRAEHSAFTDGRLTGDTGERNPNHHRAILALSTAFWDAYLLEDAAARQWLQGDGPRTILEEKDRWRKK